MISLVVVIVMISHAFAVSDFYVCGGYSGTASLATVLSYHVSSNTWSTLPSLKEAVWGGKASILNNRIYVSGNWDGVANNAKVESLRLAPGKTWKWAESMKHVRADHFQVTCDDRIFVAGGYDAAGGSLTAERSSKDAEDWKNINSMIYSRAFAGAAVIDDIIYIFGGSRWIVEYTEFEILSSCEKYDPETKAWSSIASMPAARYEALAMVNEAQTDVYVVGGHDGDDQLATTVFKYNVASNTWSTVSVLTNNSALRRAFFGGFIHSGSIYVFGGENGPTYEEFNAISTSNSVNIATGTITTLASVPYIVSQSASAFV